MSKTRYKQKNDSHDDDTQYVPHAHFNFIYDERMDDARMPNKLLISAIPWALDQHDWGYTDREVCEVGLENRRVHSAG